MNKFKAWLRKNKISENQVAGGLRRSQSALNRVVRGEGTPTLETAFLLSELARDDVTMDSFLPYRLRRRLRARARSARRELRIDR